MRFGADPRVVVGVVIVFVFPVCGLQAGGVGGVSVSEEDTGGKWRPALFDFRLFNVGVVNYFCGLIVQASFRHEDSAVFCY